MVVLSILGLDWKKEVGIFYKIVVCTSPLKCSGDSTNQNFNPSYSQNYTNLRLWESWSDALPERGWARGESQLSHEESWVGPCKLPTLSLSVFSSEFTKEYISRSDLKEMNANKVVLIKAFMHCLGFINIKVYHAP